MKKQSLAGIGLMFFFAACGGGGSGSSGSGGTNGSGGTSGGSNSGGSNGSSSGGSNGSGGQASSSGGTQGGTSSGGTQGGTTSGGPQGGTSSGGTQGGTSSGGTQGGTSSGGAQGSVTGGAMQAGAGGAMQPGSGGSNTGPSMVIVTSSSSGYWMSGSWMEASSGNATVTVNDSSTQQNWDGFGGAFNERGWMYLTSDDMKIQALKMLFDSTDGAAFSWGRIPMGASDYAINRYTCDDKGEDPAAMSSGSNRPAADTSMANFTLDQDNKYLIPYIQAAQKVNPNLRFWASPWTPPVWLKTGYKTNGGGSGAAKKPSYFDGGSYVTGNDSYLQAYADYYTKFVQGYMDKGIKIEIVSPQNEPGYDQNYPSCLWDKATYVAWVGKYLGTAKKKINVNVMLGTLSNYMDGGHADLDIASAVTGDATAMGFVTVAGVQWGVLDQINKGTKIGNLPIWATEHKCGNYPWNPDGYPKYNSSQAPNDQAYGVESWGYIRDAITKGKVTSYSAWNMVLDKSGLGNDTSRDWKQDALLVADGGKITATPAYYAFLHVSQYVVPGAKVVGTSGGDAIAFKNPDGSLVAAMYNSGSANSNFIVSIGGKKAQFAMPAQGWATVKYTP